MMTRAELAHKIYQTSHLTGEFRLRSGAISREYFDKYQFEADPVLLWEIAVAMRPLIPPDVDALAGLELGGIPLVHSWRKLQGYRHALCVRSPRSMAPVV